MKNLSVIMLLSVFFFLSCDKDEKTPAENYNLMELNCNVSNATIKGFNNGKIQVNVTGGKEPLTYSIDGGQNFSSEAIFDSLYAGTYNVYVLDGADSTITEIVQLTEPEKLTGYAENENHNITIVAVGGIPPYEYSIDNGITYQADSIFNDLQYGLYTIRIKASSGEYFSFEHDLSPVINFAGIYDAHLIYFHPNEGEYPDNIYIDEINEKTLEALTSNKCETGFATWPETDFCWITINEDHSLNFEVNLNWNYDVYLGDPYDASKVSYYDPVSGVIYLYYHYYGDGGYRVFWEVFTPKE